MRKDLLTKTILIFLFLVILITFGLIKYNDYVSFEKSFALEINFDNCYGLYETSNGNVFLCAKNCVKLINKNGSEKWSIDADFSEPVIYHDKNILAVSDLKTNVIHVYDLSGELYSIKSENKLLVFSINLTGYCTTISKSSDGSYLTDVYNNKGEKIFTHVHSEENIFPINSSVSPDNSVIAINFIDINKSTIDSKIIFSHIKNEKDNKNNTKNPEQEKNDMFAALNLENNFAYKTKFISKNNIIVFSEDQIIRAEFSNNQLKEKWRRKFEPKIDLLEANNNFLAIKQIDKNIIDLYDMSNKKLCDIKLNNQTDFLNISVDKKYFMVCERNNLNVIDSNGKTLAKYNIPGEQKFMIFMGSPNKILFGSSDKLYVANIK